MYSLDISKTIELTEIKLVSVFKLKKLLNNFTPFIYGRLAVRQILVTINADTNPRYGSIIINIIIAS